MFDLVQGILDRRLVHKSSGVRVAEAGIETIGEHLNGEVLEFLEALNDGNEEAMRDEICDVLGVVIHACLKLGMIENEVLLRMRCKFEVRFVKE